MEAEGIARPGESDGRSAKPRAGVSVSIGMCVRVCVFFVFVRVFFNLLLCCPSSGFYASGSTTLGREWRVAWGLIRFSDRSMVSLRRCGHRFGFVLLQQGRERSPPLQVSAIRSHTVLVASLIVSIASLRFPLCRHADTPRYLLGTSRRETRLRRSQGFPGRKTRLARWSGHRYAVLRRCTAGVFVIPLCRPSLQRR